jgi:Uma2 family endonuclease
MGMKLADLDLNKAYTYADYLQWSFKERVELIKGKVLKMSPAPNPRHQVLSMEISGRMWDFLKGKECRVYPAPFDVRLSHKAAEDSMIATVVQPDISVVCDPGKIDGKGCIGAPDIVVEILSPSNNEQELKHKYEVYEQSGVKEYWVVFPAERMIIIYTLMDGRFAGSRPYTVGSTISSSVLSGFSLNVSELFSQA